jgi:hypothetical protein
MKTTACVLWWVVKKGSPESSNQHNKPANQPDDTNKEVQQGKSDWTILLKLRRSRQQE